MPSIGLAEGLLIAVKALPAVSFLFATVLRQNCAPVSIVTPLATTWSAAGFLGIQFPNIAPITFEDEGISESYRRRIARAFARLERTSGAAAGSNRGLTGDNPSAAERATANLDRTAAVAEPAVFLTRRVPASIVVPPA